MAPYHSHPPRDKGEGLMGVVQERETDVLTLSDCG
jgi:hypothetical protein